MTTIEDDLSYEEEQRLMEEEAFLTMQKIEAEYQRQFEYEAWCFEQEQLEREAVMLEDHQHSQL